MAEQPDGERHITRRSEQLVRVSAPSPSRSSPPESPRGSSWTKKRAASMAMDESDNQQGIQNLSIETPKFDRQIINGDIAKDTCLCTPAPKIPRPRNAFILYRQHHQAQVVAQNPGLANPEVSKIIGEQWNREPDDKKQQWKRLAEEEKQRHQRQFPDYRYQPRRGGKSGAASVAGRQIAVAGGAGAEESGRCPKCGGRYIATPRTPGLGSSLATTPTTALSLRTAASASATPSHNIPSAGVFEMDDLQPDVMSHDHRTHSQIGQQYPYSYALPLSPRGGIPSRYPLQDQPQPPQHYYATVLPSGSPEAKRRRLYDDQLRIHHGMVPNRTATQQIQSLLSENEPHGYHPPLMAPQSRNFGQPLTDATMQGPMAPPPAPSQQTHLGMQPGQTPLSYPPAAPSAGLPPLAPIGPRFDESLRLPPLHSHLARTGTGSPPADPLFASNAAAAAATTTLTLRSAMIGTPAPAPQPSEKTQLNAAAAAAATVIRAIPYPNKLAVLDKIRPPLAPAAAHPRGPVIAIEGPDAALVRRVGAVVERALRDEYAVQTWRGRDGDGASPRDGFAAGALFAQYLDAIKHWHGQSDEIVRHVTTASATTTTITTTAAAALAVADGQARGSVSSASSLSTVASSQFSLSLASHDGSSSTSRSEAALRSHGSRRASADDELALPPHPRRHSAAARLSTSMVSARPGTTGHTGASRRVLLAPAPAPSATTAGAAVAPAGGGTAVAAAVARLPVALLAGGYSLTASDAYAAAIPIGDSYAPVDHWQWMATLWRGIVGPDLVVYVRAVVTGPGDLPGSAGGRIREVEFKADNLLAVRVPVDGNYGECGVGSDTAAASAGQDGSGAAGGAALDEKAERRLGFEVSEWVRSWKLKP